LLFCISSLLLVWSSAQLSSRLASSHADGYWIFIASAMLQIGAIASLTSLFNQLHPWAWVLVQALIGTATHWFTGGRFRPNFQALVMGWRRLRAELSAFVAALTPWGMMALFASAAILTLSAVTQVATPISGYDERMYHASRVLYWIQNQSILPYITHNIRQTMVPFGSELFFLWPVLLTKIEWVGRLVFWLAYPLAAAGQYFLLRRLALSRTIALVGVLILVSTPLVASSAIGLKPELWSVLSLLGVAYWVVSICVSSEGMKTKYFFLGVFTILSINVRSFPMAILPSLILIVWWTRSSFSVVARLKALAAGLLCATLTSSLLVPLVSNFILYNHPLGPAEVRHIVQADLTPKVIYTHAVRFVFLLLELPDVPASAETRTRFSNAANQVIATIGADTPLAWEGDQPWPGKFQYSLLENSKRFSLWGLLWIPTLLISLALAVRNLVVTMPKVTLTPVSAQTLLAIPLLVVILFGARWMTQSEVPGRFLIGPYALLLPIGIAIVGPYISARKLAHVFVAIIVSYAAYHPIRAQAYGAGQALAAPISAKDVNEPFDEVVNSMQTGFRVLFVGNHDAPDYPLFSPATHYSSAVIPWGTGAFDPERMRHLIDSQRVTHVLIQHDERVIFHWFPNLPTAKMMNWLGAQPGFKVVPLSTPRMRLFEVASSGWINEAALLTTALPSDAPLITIEKSLQTHVGIDPSLLKTPWSVENLGGTEGGFLWIGQGRAEGMEFGLWSRKDRSVELRLNVSPGPSLTTLDRAVVLLHDGVPTEQTFKGSSAIVFRLRLHAGRNVISFFALDAATIKSMPNGDTRRLVVGLHDVQVNAGPASADGDAKPLSQGPPSSGGNTDLAHSARAAVGLISSRQQLDGFWTTAYTSDERFENPKLEMNTFVTSLMIDILSATTIADGLRWSVEQGRTHLNQQIEATGLVRYHGRPDAAAMSAYGLCPITPDADDTALVWRIAPGAAPLRASALATLMRYRTEDGLYKTWLDQRSEYRCIDPGADPNPTDVGIQMNVLMWLAQVDPPAARALCSALRPVIDEDRIWVYYRRAPLIPLLRQTDLQTVGCPLQLPSSRSQSPVAGQSVWMTAAQLLRRLRSGGEQMPSSTQVLDLLRTLSSDDFSALRATPPLLYHNDLSATVRRFYWSEDVGYAIWLSLYAESVRHGFLRSSSENAKAIAGGEKPLKP
jgi:hypothetical protein